MQGDAMGGRGASSGISKYGNAYGTQYRSLLTVGNVKYVRKTSKSAETLMETMTAGRVYALVDAKDAVKSIIYFDKDNKRSRQIDIDDRHGGTAHVHHGYLHNENSPNGKPTALTTKERAMVDRVLEDWENAKRKS